MAVTITATPGSSSANSYVTANEAATYIAAHYIPTDVSNAWNNQDSDTQALALIQATMLLDRLVAWNGYVVTSSVQSLAWPRANAFDRYDRAISSSAIPTFLKDFTIETALWLVSLGGMVPEESGTQFNSIRIEGIQVKYADGTGKAPLSYLPDTVIACLEPMGTYAAQMPRGPRAIPLQRV